MSFVIGRGEGESSPGEYVCQLGTYRARDGSSGADLYLDLDRPHAALVVGKRGYGKSYTLGVIAEALATAPAVAPVILDPMGIFGSIAAVPGTAPNRLDSSIEATVVDEPHVCPDVLDPRSWCALLALSPESAAGSLVWQAAEAAACLADMRAHIQAASADPAAKRAAANHLRLAAGWDIFDPEGLDASALGTSAVTVVDVSGLDPGPMNAVCRGIAEALYRARVSESMPRLPWLLVDEAHAFFDNVATKALTTILTRGRAPGVSLVLATQRPSHVPEVAISQSDLFLSHRLTAEVDLEALEAVQPTYMTADLADRLPTTTGEVLVVDDATETVHAATIRKRRTPHAGDSPSASEISLRDAGGSREQPFAD